MAYEYNGSVMGSDTASSMIGGDQADEDTVLMAQERTRLNAEVHQLETTLPPLIHPDFDLHDLDNDAALEV